MNGLKCISDPPSTRLSSILTLERWSNSFLPFSFLLFFLGMDSGDEGNVSSMGRNKSCQTSPRETRGTLCYDSWGIGSEIVSFPFHRRDQFHLRSLILDGDPMPISVSLRREELETYGNQWLRNFPSNGSDTIPMWVSLSLFDLSLISYCAIYELPSLRIQLENWWHDDRLIFDLCRWFE